jgi:hypothetical protein
MKFRTFISALTAFATLLVVAGLGLLAGLTLNSPLSLIDKGSLVAPQAFQFVPRQSPLVASVLTRPEKLGDLWQYLAAPTLRQTVKQDIQKLERTLLAGTGLTYERDIAPWVGDEITAAIVTLDLDQNPDNGEQAGYLVALSCVDSQSAKAVLELFWQNRAIAGDSLTFEDFSGTRLIYSQANSELTATGTASLLASEFDLQATAIVANRFVLAANHPQVLRQALTVAQSSDLNLQADRRYRQALHALSGKRIGLLAFGLPLELPGGQIASSPHSPDNKSLSLETLGKAGDVVDWGLMSLALNRQGILANVALVAARGHQLQPRPVNFGNLPNLAEQLPPNLAIGAMGRNLDNLWEIVSPLIAPYEQQWVGLKPLVASLGEELADEVTDIFLEGVKDGYALGMKLGANSNGKADWLLITEHTSAMETSLQELDNLAQEQGVATGHLTVRNYPTTVWTQLSLSPGRQTFNLEQPFDIVAQVTGLHTQMGDYDVLTESAQAMNTVLAQSEVTDDSPSDYWDQWSGLLKQPNEGYIYLNWPALELGLSRQNNQFRLLAAASKPLLKHLKTVTLTSYGRTDALQTGGLFFELSNG